MHVYYSWLVMRVLERLSEQFSQGGREAREGADAAVSA